MIFFFLKQKAKGNPETGEMAQGLRTLAALPEGVGLIPITHTVTHNHL